MKLVATTTRRQPAGRGSTTQDLQIQSRLVARLIRTVLATERFETLADLTCAVKTRCARLRLPCSPDVLSAAYAAIGSDHPLTDAARRLDKRCLHRRIRDGRCLTCGWLPPDGAAVTRAEASAILQRLGVRL